MSIWNEIPRTAILLSLCLASSLLAHQASPERRLTALRLQGESPCIDGRLDDAIWQVAPVYTGFVQREPDEGKPATEPTTVQFAYDDQALYVAIMAGDREPDKIVGRLVRRDQWTEADHVQLSLDTHHDHQTAYWFEVNAAGAIEDGIVTNDGDGWDPWDSTWDGVWESKHALGDQGWSVEFRIPFQVLRFNPAEEYVWGVNVMRYISRKKETDFWVMVPRNESGWVSRFAHLEGIRGIRPQRAIQFLPYGVGRSTFAPAGDPDHRKLFGNLGGDLRYGLTSSIYLNATINPDFGQVEADPAELNLTVFETFQEERRPFFVEGSQYFKTPINLFYSRRIGRQPGYREIPDGYEVAEETDFTTILGAAKVTGKTTGQTTFGLLGAATADEYVRIDSIATGPAGEEIHHYRRFLIEPQSYFLVGRLKQDLFKGNSHVGLLATALDRRGGGDAFAGGIDWNLKWRNNGYEFWGQVSGSRAGETGDRQSGLGNVVVLGKKNGWLRGSLWWEAFSQGFEINDLGFQRRNDYYSAWSWIQVRDERPRLFFRKTFLNFNRWGMWNSDGINLENTFNFNCDQELKNYWWIRLEFNHRFRARDDLDTRGGPLIVRPASREWEIRVESDERRMVSGWAEVEWEEDAVGSTRRELTANLKIRPRANLEIRLRPQYEWAFDDAQWVENLDVDGDGEDDRFVYGELRRKTLDLTTRINVLFSRDLSLEFYLQPFITAGDYRNFKELARPSSYEFIPHPAPEDNPDFRLRSLQGNLVLRWEYRPGSTLFLVWSQSREDESERPWFRPWRHLARTFADEGTNIFLVKLNYWLPL